LVFQYRLIRCRAKWLWFLQYEINTDHDPNLLNDQNEVQMAKFKRVNVIAASCWVGFN
jgi:hypothetical protein